MPTQTFIMDTHNMPTYTVIIGTPKAMSTYIVSAGSSSAMPSYYANLIISSSWIDLVQCQLKIYIYLFI